MLNDFNYKYNKYSISINQINFINDLESQHNNLGKNLHSDKTQFWKYHIIQWSIQELVAE